MKKSTPTSSDPKATSGNPDGTDNTAELYAALLDTADTGSIAISQDGTICHWNRWMQTRSDLTPHQVLGKQLAEVFPETRLGRVSQAIEDCLKFGMPAVISPSLNQGALPLKPLPQFAASFDRMEQSIRIHPIKTSNDGTLCSLTIRDVTLAVQRDRLLRQQATELADLVTQTRRSEGRTRAILQNTVDAILVASDDGNIEPLNARAQELCGPEGDPELRNIIRFLLPDSGNTPPPRPPQDRILTDLGTGVIEVLACSPGKRDVPLEVAISHFSTDGRYHYIITLRDISQRKRHEMEIQRTMTELERSNSELEQFAYAASHDLQEPLRMVSSYTQLLARRYEGQLDDTADEFIHYAVDGTQRMQRMIDDLLTLSRVGRHGKPFHAVALSALFDALVTNFRRAGPTPEGNIIREGTLPTVTGDASQLLLLFQNLVSNGLKYSDPENGQVRIYSEETPNSYRVFVADNGIGIEEQYHETIFEVFKRLHGYGDYAGTGIGLAICKKIVERHGGSLSVTSTPGEGSIFCVEFPKELAIVVTPESM
ncbi:ATP-binding protein [Thalassospira lucentensis]|uniref:ATP-binding protein n=1 Tax=Thalassospira lucentensis TaxID=168935 RepID=UPI00142E353A|nr:ATP-binding protein [Thalassospira lucentensis]NIZ00226.1 PAS domain S-box protein [Thalassospira lucentensis]